ncbi:MAG: hypothetical protein AAF715_16650 [Myxococcota bacterium]
MMQHRRRFGLGVMAAVSLGTLGCRETTAPADAPATSAADAAPIVSAPVFERKGAPDGSAVPTAVAPPVEEAAPEVAGHDEAGASNEEEAEGAGDDAPLPAVDVKNVGMHIGGEENTAAQKRPIRQEVAKQYDAMKRCWARADTPPDKATFGVDMRIEGEGGPARIQNPRSGLRGEGVKQCMVEAFEAVVFPRQPGGVDRMVSFSVEFRRTR